MHTCSNAFRSLPVLALSLATLLSVGCGRSVTETGMVISAGSVATVEVTGRDALVDLRNLGPGTLEYRFTKAPVLPYSSGSIPPGGTHTRSFETRHTVIIVNPTADPATLDVRVSGKFGVGATITNAPQSLAPARTDGGTSGERGAITPLESDG